MLIQMDVMVCYWGQERRKTPILLSLIIIMRQEALVKNKLQD